MSAPDELGPDGLTNSQRAATGSHPSSDGWIEWHGGGCPCLVPVGFGLMAPSGVLMIGAALVLRDLVQERFGPGVTLGAIVAGALLSVIRAALNPGLTKAAYIGEFFEEIDIFNPEYDEGDPESDDGPYLHVRVPIQWTTIKQIMAAICARAALTSQSDGEAG